MSLFPWKQCFKCGNLDSDRRGFYCIITGGANCANGKYSDFEPKAPEKRKEQQTKKSRI